MKRSVLYFLLFVMVLVVAIIFLPANNSNLYRSELDDKLTKLKQDYNSLEPYSPYRRVIEEQIRELAGFEEAENIAENPGAFYEAMAGLKTKADGSTYPLNYKQKALVNTQRRAKSFKTAPIWTARGPHNINGRARAIVVDQNDPQGNTWFVGTVGGGIWKTADAGDSWEPIADNMTSLSITTLAQSGNTLYAGTGMGYGRILDLSGAGVWKSEDNGDTWFQLESTANGELLQAINRIVTDPNDPDVVVLCSNDSYSWNSPKGGTRESGIFRSEDGGETWEQTFDPDAALGSSTDNRVQQIIANPLNFNTLFATINEVGVIRSGDGGKTWSVMANNMARPQDIGANQNTYSGVSTRIEMAMAPSDTNRLYAAAERPFGVGQLYYSGNAGNTWKILVQSNGPEINWFGARGRSGAYGYTAGWFDNTIAVDPIDKNVVYLGGVELYKTEVNELFDTHNIEISAPYYTQSGGDYSYVHADHHFLVTIRGGDSYRIVNANDGGIAVSEDAGASWTPLSGIISSQFYGVDKKPGSSVYIGGMQDNGTAISSEDPDINSFWLSVIGGDGVEVAWHKSDPNQMLAGYQYGNYYKSSDEGFSWAYLAEAKAGSNGPFISKLGTSPQDHDLVFTVGNAGVNRSDDFGDTWTLTPITNNWHGFRAFDNVEVSLASPQVVWISSRIGNEPLTNTNGGIHLSEDGGLSFTNITSNIDFNVLEASGIATHPSDPNTGYLLFSAPDAPKILRTTDLGETWEDLSGFGAGAEESLNGFPDVGVFSLLVMPFDTDIIWAGTEIGIFASEDGGESWGYLDGEIPHVSIFEMKIVDSEIIVATYGRGIWTASLPELQNYTPPTATLSPRISSLNFLPSGSVDIEIDLRSAYDSTHIIVDGAFYKTVGSNEEGLLVTESFPVISDGTRSVSIISYKDDDTFKSPEKSIEVFLTSPQNYFVSNSDGSLNQEDFHLDGLSITSQIGFTGTLINSSHYYSDNSTSTATLKTPIIVSEEDAVLSYKDIALVEPGDPGTVFGDSNFWDYVIVEGTVDGTEWIPLAPGYDARFNSTWQNYYFMSTVPEPSLFETHTINLLNTFDPGDVIFVRFRMFADAAVNGWGWIVSDINIQEGILSAEPDSRPESFSLSQNYPNPFNPETTIEYNLESSSDIEIRVYNVSGQLVQTLYNGFQTSGTHHLTWNASGLSSGSYFYVLRAGDFTEIKRATLIK